MNITRCSSARWIGFFCVQSTILAIFSDSIFFSNVFMRSVMFLFMVHVSHPYVAVGNIIRNISMCQIVLSYCKHLTHAHMNGRTHTRAHAPARTPAHPHTHTHRRRCIAIRCQPTVTARSAGDNSGSLAFEINTGTGGQVSPMF